MWYVQNTSQDGAAEGGMRVDNKADLKALKTMMLRVPERGDVLTLVEVACLAA